MVLAPLNTHTKASLSEAFPPDEARASARQLEFHDTPQQGSWLHLAEMKLAVLSNRCLSARIADDETRKREIDANVSARKAKAEPVQWQFTNQEARCQLARLSPRVST